jgi:GT2 family glycosyltransferase
MTAGVSLVIVDYNAGDVLLRCLEAVALQTHMPSRLLLVDNAGTDGSFEKARAFVASNSTLAGMTEILRNEKNLGFAAANNAAAARCDTEFLALLNPDAVPEPDWLEKLVAAAKRHPRAASFASRQMLDVQRGLVDGLGDVYHPIGICWRRRHGKVLRSSDLVEKETTSACAAAALYRCEAFEGVGGFDEKFFCYVEDVDLGLRLRRAGHTAVFVPDAVVEHTSKNSRSDFAVYHGQRNIEWCFFKNTAPAKVVLFLVPHLLVGLAAFAVCAMRGQALVFLSAKFDALRAFARFKCPRAAELVAPRDN